MDNASVGQIRPDNDCCADRKYNSLRADCANCFGLCCVALNFAGSAGFPADKTAGAPCSNLQADFTCCVYQSLEDRGLKGCITFDCFGAGQRVSQLSYAGKDWRIFPESAQEMFAVYQVMRQLHEMLWYLTEAMSLQAARPIHQQVKMISVETEHLTMLSPDKLLALQVSEHRNRVKALLLQAGEMVQSGFRSPRKDLRPMADYSGANLRRADLTGANFRGACLIAADLRGAELRGANFLGADCRDADLRETDLSQSIFLTQAQVNGAKGNTKTRLPAALLRPRHWST